MIFNMELYDVFPNRLINSLDYYWFCFQKPDKLIKFITFWNDSYMSELTELPSDTIDVVEIIKKNRL